MEENENENKESAVNKDEIKEETVKTAKEVKETIKNVDIKKDAKATTGFITEMIKNPLTRLKEIANDKDNKDFKYAVVLAVVWIIVNAILHLSSYSSIDSFFAYRFTRHFLSLLKVMIAPIVGIIVMSAIIFVMNKKNKKSFMTILTAITAAQIPVIVADILGLLRIFSTSIAKLLTPFSMFCTIISTIFMFFASKALFGEEDNSKFLKTFVIIQAIYYVAYLIISYLEIYI